MPVREEEKVELSKLVELVPVPIKGGPEEACSKISVLLQAYISKLALEGFSLKSDMVFVEQNSGRIMRALFEIALKNGWACLAKRCLMWCKVIDRRMWPVQTPLRHFKTVPEDLLRYGENDSILIFGEYLCFCKLIYDAGWRHCKVLN